LHFGPSTYEFPNQNKDNFLHQKQWIHQQTLADYSSSAPESLRNEQRIGGYFVAIGLDEFSAESIEATSVYSRKDFYKIALATGHAIFHRMNKEYQIRPDECALIFTYREAPYRWDVLTETAVVIVACPLKTSYPRISM
jgi:hypothetical protein